MMILSYPGAEYSHGSVKYAIGSTVMATDQSPYQGLLGTIVEIRDGQDRETQNETPDIYCSFDTPVIPAEIEKLEKVFSILLGTPKTLQDISLQRVIMAPDMIQVLHDQTVPSPQTDIWVLLEDWANNGDFGSSLKLFSAYAEARRTMIDMLREELDFGLIADIQSDSLFSVMSDDNYYEAWIEGEYLLTHYRLWMEKMPLHLTEPLRPKLASTEAK
ncbi:hypothetical protein B5F36_00440 [Anaerofilum sp. An201]|nr:hypothetical protein [Anaerofilum sp. An201]OUP05295.1 hypothetical protein B5F36_00440 [Anaerofilum sp. An201]